DGNFLMFSNWLTPTSAIYKLNLRTGAATKLPGSDGLFFPRWSPGEDRIAALSANKQKLLIFDDPKQKWTPLTDLTAARPNWSRDGQYVYFDSTSEGEPAFYRVRVRDHKLERVTSLANLK